VRRLGVVADDLTGAMDSGVQFAKLGLHTVVMLDDAEPPVAEVVVISTDSRDSTAEAAYELARDAAGRLRDRAVYKKIDSTLRGNIGRELDGLLDGLGLERGLVAPAFPSAGRTTVDGCHRVDGVSLAESVFAADPTWPATESHLPTLLRKQTRRPVGHLPLSVVLQGEHEVARALTNEPASVVAADASEPGHLRTLALALTLVENEWLPCGSAGLAEAWPLALGLCNRREATSSWSRDLRPVLVVSGSRHQATARQLGEASADGDLRVVDLSVGEHDWRREAEICAVPLLGQGLNVALTTTFSPYREDSAAANAEMLAQAAMWVLEHSSVSGLVMTGGDVARAVCRALDTSALHVLNEVQPGIPAGRLLGGACDGLRVVTKAGGFGDALAIAEAVRYIRGEGGDHG
jgi:uncharacterized protein YgbK (DUF1537 family)